jgi:hypothetical protein
MILKRQSKLSGLGMALIFSGCTTVQPSLRPEPLPTFPPPTVGQVQEGLEVSVDEFASPEKSREVFKVTVSKRSTGYEIGNVAAEVGSYGVLPLRLHVFNRGDGNYQVNKNDIKALLGGQPLARLSGKEAADQGASGEYKKASTWDAFANTAVVALSPLLPLLLLLALEVCKHPECFNQSQPAPCSGYSLYYTCTVGKFQQLFEYLELTDTLLKPGDTAAGFVYFKLPEKVKRLENLMAEVTVEKEASEGQTGKQLIYKFSLPTLEVSGS